MQSRLSHILILTLTWGPLTKVMFAFMLRMEHFSGINGTDQFSEFVPFVHGSEKFCCGLCHGVPVPCAR